MRLGVLLALAAGLMLAEDKILPLDVRYRLVKRAAQIAARERQIAKLQEEIQSLTEENQKELKEQRSFCTDGEIVASPDDELVCRTKDEKK